MEDTAEMSLAEIGSSGAPSAGPMSRSALVGRTHEQGAVREVIDSVRAGRSGALVLRGEPGMGRSALIDWARDEASDLRVLSVVGLETEATFPYAGTHRLLLPLLDGIGALPAHHVRALELVFGQAVDAAPDRHAVGLAVLDLLTRSAERSPVLCLADDAQWLDAQSLDVLGIVARRLHSGGVGVVATVCEHDGVAPALHGVAHVDVRPLVRTDAIRLVRATAASAVGPHVADQIAALCAGFPLAIVAMTRSLSATQLSGATLLPVVPAISTPRDGFFLHRIRSLPKPTQMLLLVAAADPTGDPDTFHRAATSLGVPLEAIDPAIDDGLVARDEPHRFLHPFGRFAVYADASATMRRRVRDALAPVIEPAGNADRHAMHIAAEPVRFATRAQRRIEPTHDPLIRARLQRALAALDDFTVTYDAAATLLAAARALEEIDIRLARDTYAEALQASLISGSSTRGTTPTQVAELVLLAPRPPSEATVIDGLLDALAERLAGDGAVAAPRLRDAVDSMCEGSLGSTGRTLWSFLGQAAVLEIWDPERYRAMLRHLERQQRALGDLDCLRITLLGLCRSELWAGDFTSADGHRQEAAALSLEIDGPGASAQLWASTGAELTAWQGLERETRLSFSVLTGEYARAVGAGAAQSIGWLALTTLELSLGRSREALRAARVLFDDDVPPDATLVLPDLVEAGVRSGDTDAAHAAFDRLHERTSCSGTNWALGVNARCRALLSDDGEAETHFELALEHLGRTVVRTDLARTHLLYGEWLRRGKRRIDARRHLGEAHSQFERMGAQLFAERARREVEATGAHVRKRSPGRTVELTPQEERIARRAAAGDTNAEIAERLYISPRTVDYHLRKVYRKLGVASRRDLRSLFPPG